ncbi:MAG: hypothetical protein Q3976_01550 [Corynebacterium sp.]|nr:hypothetical protein [Corynebacterium sp.]
MRAKRLAWVSLLSGLCFIVLLSFLAMAQDRQPVLPGSHKTVTIESIAENLSAADVMESLTSAATNAEAVIVKRVPGNEGADSYFYIAPENVEPAFRERDFSGAGAREFIALTTDDADLVGLAGQYEVYGDLEKFQEALADSGVGIESEPNGNNWFTQLVEVSGLSGIIIAVSVLIVLIYCYVGSRYESALGILHLQGWSRAASTWLISRGFLGTIALVTLGFFAVITLGLGWYNRWAQFDQFCKILATLYAAFILLVCCGLFLGLSFAYARMGNFRTQQQKESTAMFGLAVLAAVVLLFVSTMSLSSLPSQYGRYQQAQSASNYWEQSKQNYRMIINSGILSVDADTANNYTREYAALIRNNFEDLELSLRIPDVLEDGSNIGIVDSYTAVAMGIIPEFDSGSAPKLVVPKEISSFSDSLRESAAAWLEFQAELQEYGENLPEIAVNYADSDIHFDTFAVGALSILQQAPNGWDEQPFENTRQVNVPLLVIDPAADFVSDDFWLSSTSQGLITTQNEEILANQLSENNLGGLIPRVQSVSAIPLQSLQEAKDSLRMQCIYGLVGGLAAWLAIWLMISLYQARVGNKVAILLAQGSTLYQAHKLFWRCSLCGLMFLLLLLASLHNMSIVAVLTALPVLIVGVLVVFGYLRHQALHRLRDHLIEL